MVVTITGAMENSSNFLNHRKDTMVWYFQMYLEKVAHLVTFNLPSVQELKD
ncbi:Uncharacterised protein [Mycobacterium tuberculosis]|nr:Uncharacterised protein [Mycobacterium tuberculosis]